MAQDISLLGAVYSDVPSVLLPKQGGGTAQFDDTTDADATASDILSGKTAYVNGVKITGTGTGGGGSVTQDQDGFIVLPPTGGGGGGGGQYAWFGQGTTYVNRLYSQTVNLKDDTTYDSWTASTTAGDIKPASSTTDFSLTVDYDNVYWLVVRYYVDIAYVSGITLKKVPKNFVCYNVSALSPQFSTYNALANDTCNSVYAVTALSKYGFVYYDNSESLAYGNNINYGPMFCTSMPTLSSSGTTYSYKCSSIRARCNSTYFDTTQKVNIDSANTNMLITVDVYKTPKENTFYGEMLKNMRTDLLS